MAAGGALTGACRALLGRGGVQYVARRAAHAKRFYKTTSVAGTTGCYEINLDHRKLKTPLGNILQVPSYPLALAIAEEWAGVQDVIKPTFMHLTGMAYTVVDNPSKVSKWDMTDGILEFLPTDTILFADVKQQDDSPLPLGREKFIELQAQHWWPLLSWFNTRHHLALVPSTGIQPAVVTEADTAVLRRHILSYNHWAVAGLVYGVECVKSVVLALSALDRHISAEDAVRLSRLEVDYQTDSWGRVEWGHDMDHRDLECRFAAALLFAHLNSAMQVKRKMKGEQQHV